MGLLEIVIMLYVAGMSFLFGMDYGQRRERRWQAYKRRMNRRLARHQRTVDHICNEYKTIGEAAEYAGKFFH